MVGFVLVATGVIWRRSYGIAHAVEERRLEQQRGALEAERAKLEGDIREASSRASLAGVARGLVIGGCREEGLTVRAEPLPMSILHQAQEVFITSSTKDVMGIHAIGDTLIPAPGPVTARAAEIFARRSAQHLDP